jgi:hypothetical protein
MDLQVQCLVGCALAELDGHVVGQRKLVPSCTLGLTMKDE